MNGKNRRKKMKEREREKNFATHKLKIRSHGKQHGGYESRRMNTAFGQLKASADEPYRSTARIKLFS